MKSSSSTERPGFDAHPLARRIAAARELTSTIPTLTLAGQRFAMDRIIALLCNGDWRGQHPRFEAHLDRLNQEVIHPMPDVQAFQTGAASLLDGLCGAVC